MWPRFKQRGLLISVSLVLGANTVWAYRMEEPQPFFKWDCPSFSRLNHYLAEIWNITNGRYAVDTLNFNPNGLRNGDRGEMVQATFPASTGTRFFCVNMSNPSPGSDWVCVGLGPLRQFIEIPAPTTGIFCPGVLTTNAVCEEFRGRIPQECTLNRVDATVTVAPVNSGVAGQTTGILVDVNECTTPAYTSCTSVWNNSDVTVTTNPPLNIVSGQLVSAVTAFDRPTIENGNYIGFDIDKVGTSTPGSHLTVTLVCQ